MDIISEIGPNESENKDFFISKGYTSNKEQRKQ